jgi:hypothetical protein
MNQPAAPRAAERQASGLPPAVLHGALWLGVLIAALLAIGLAAGFADFGPWWVRVGVLSALVVVQLAVLAWGVLRIAPRLPGRPFGTPSRSALLMAMLSALAVSLLLLLLLDLHYVAPLVFLAGAAVGLVAQGGPEGRRGSGAALALMVSVAVAAGAWVLHIPASTGLAGFRAGLFYSTLRDVRLQARVAPDTGEVFVDVSFTAPWSIGLLHSERAWRGVQRHDTWVPYTAPVIHWPALDFGFVEVQGVNGQRDLGGTASLERIERNGAAYDGALLHRAGRYVLHYRWLDRAGIRSHSGEFTEGVCVTERAFHEERLTIDELARDRRFVQPVELRLSSTYFSPVRRWSWGRERGFGRPGEVRVTRLAQAAAPFSAHDLARLRLQRLSDPQASECNPGERLHFCLQSGTQCEPPDLAPARAAAWAALEAARR